MPPIRSLRNIFMQLRKVCQHPYLNAPELEDTTLPEEEQHKRLTSASGKLAFLKLLLPKLKERGHRVLLFSQYKIALDLIQDFLHGEGYKFLRLDGDIQQAQRQKDIDVFNAPDSEYFIFLLTTRAGGVGINLATADTVIVYDPDFNPHQDLQAIARSHRYGQKKKVMVFKLMTRDSVEERIIQSGKKKLVLDHLVVQNLGKETEEGDVESMILYGAKALYEDSEKNDIVYTSKDIDDMIDNVEKQAEEKAKAMEEWAKKGVEGVNGHANGDSEAAAEASRPKETMSFGFAKIWESGKKDVQEVAEEDEAMVEDDLVDNWALIMENAEKEKQKRLAEEAEGLRAKRARREAIDYRTDPTNLDDTPKKKKWKGKGKALAVDSSSDAEFAVNSQASASEDEDMTDLVPEGPDDLLDHDTRIAVANGLTGKKRLSKREMKALEAAKLAEMARAQAQSAAAAAPPPNTIDGNNGQSNSSRKRAGETADQRAARKQARRADKLAARVADVRQDIMTSASRMGDSPRKMTVVESERIRQGQHVLQWLYSLLREFNLAAELKVWGRMGLVELPPAERQLLYVQLAQITDRHLQAMKQNPIFTLPQSVKTVNAVFEGCAPAIPDAALGAIPPPPMLPQAGVMSRTFDQAGSDSKKRSPSKGNVPMPNPRSTSQATQGFATASDATDPLLAESLREGQVGASAHRGTLSAIAPPATNGAGSQPLASSSQLSQLPNGTSAQNGFPDQSEAFLEKLYGTKGAIATSTETAQKKLEALQRIDRLISDTLAAINGGNSSSQASREPVSQISLGDSATNGFHSNGHGFSSRRAASVTALGEPSANTHTSTPRKRKIPTKVKGCTICGSKREHPAYKCPAVLAGPESIKAAISKFQPDEPLHGVLTSFYDQAMRAKATTETCAFCETYCGREPRACAGEHGGRKALKSKIRELSTAETGEYGSQRLNKLFEVYEAWPREVK